MEGNPTVGRRGGRRWMRYLALAVALLWAGFWIFFGLASGLGEGLDPVGVVIHTAVPGLAFLVPAAVAWRWSAAGGALMVVLGVVILIGYPMDVGGRFPIQTIVFVLLTMALPPLVAGTLFLLDWRAWRKS